MTPPRIPIHRRRPSPAMAVALLALFVALGGTATAATFVISSSKQVKNGAIRGADLKKRTVTGVRIANGAISQSKLSTGLKQALGAVATSGGGPSKGLESYRRSGPTDQAANTSATVVTMADIPAGTYALFAKTVMEANPNDAGLLGQGQSASGHCKLDVDGDADDSRVLLGSPGGSAPGTLSMQLTRTFTSTGTAKLICDAAPTRWTAANSSIVAVQLASSPRTEVGG